VKRLGWLPAVALISVALSVSATAAPKPLDALRVGGIVDAELFPGAEVGARARFDAVNAAGGIHGRRVEFLGVTDDRRDPSVTSSEIRRLTRDARVDAIVPVVSSRFTDDGTLAAARVPAFGWGIAGGFCGNRWAFAITGCLAPLLPRAVPGIWGRLVASVLRARGVRNPTAAIVVETAAVPRSLDELRAVVEAAGIRVTYAEAVLGTGGDAATGVDTIATEILSTGHRAPSAVFTVGGFGAVGALQDALRSRGYDGVMTNLVQYSPLLVGAARGTYVLTQFATPESAAGNPAMREILRDISAVTTAPVSPSMLAGYLAADLWVRAARAAGTDPSPSRVARMARKMRFRVPRTVGPTAFPAALLRPTSCGQLVTSDGATFRIAVGYRCSGYVRVG
jgi:branched-chain amino acid transport system substrate-binding protein